MTERNNKRGGRPLGSTEANDILDYLLSLSEGDRLNALSIAREYADHASLARIRMPAGTRLIMQLRLAIDEVRAMKGD